MGMQLDPGSNLESFLSKQVTLRLSLGVWGNGKCCWVRHRSAGSCHTKQAQKVSRVKPGNVVSPRMQAPDLELKIAQATQQCWTKNRYFFGHF